MKFKWPHRRSYVICRHTAAPHYLTTAQTITTPNALYPRLSKLFVSITVSVSIRAHIINYLFYGTFNIYYDSIVGQRFGTIQMGASVLMALRFWPECTFRLHNNGILLIRLMKDCRWNWFPVCSVTHMIGLRNDRERNALVFSVGSIKFVCDACVCKFLMTKLWIDKNDYDFTPYFAMNSFPLFS